MLPFARAILVLAVALGGSVAGALNGRVLCFHGPGHWAVEAAHPATGCPDGRHDAPGRCVDVSADVDLVRESALGQPDFQYALSLLPPPFVEPLRFAPVPASLPARPDLWQHSPAPGDLARLSAIVLTI